MSASTPGPSAAAGPSLVWRAVLALGLTVVFYALAIAFGVAAVGVPIARWASGEGFPVFIGIMLIVAGVSVLVSIVPRRERFVAPGPALDAAGQPELFRVVEDVAREVGHPLPDEVYLAADVNASVGEEGLPLTRKKRVLVLGLPILELLTVDQLRGVLAHEFGHYVGGDTRISRYVYRTRAAILRTVSALDHGEDDSLFMRIVRAPFAAYAKLFMRITSAVSRKEEYAADAMAIRVAGRDAHVGALRRIAAGAPAYDAFWDDELVPALDNGLRPPVGEGFRRFMSAGRIDEAVGQMLEDRLEQSRHDPYDSHPTLRQRLEAAGAAPDEDPPADGPRAATLLREHDALEEELFVALAGDDARSLRRASWEEAEEVWLDRYERFVAERGDVLEGRTLVDVPELARDVPALAAGLRARDEELNDEEAERMAFDLLGAATVLGLVAGGCAFDAPPGEPIACVAGDDRLLPWDDLAALARGDVEPAAWRARLEAAGVGAEPLARAPASSR